MENKGLNDLIKKGDISPEESQKKLKEIEALLNNTEPIVEHKTKLPFLIIGLLIIVFILIILVNVLDSKISKSPKTQIEIREIR